jgi:hypothetical protein
MLTLGLMAVAAIPSFSFAQDRQTGRGGGFDPSQFKQMMLDRAKERLNPASEDEWKVISDKLGKVMDAQRDYRMPFDFGGGRGGRGGDRGGDSNRSRDRGADSQNKTAVSTAANDLKEALDNKETPQEQVTAKLAALRDARAKAKTKLEAAQKDLQGVLTGRQEAVLVSMQMLD